MLCPTLISVRLTPPILIDDIGERDTADRPEPTHRVADRQQGVRVETRRRTECGLRFLLELQIKRGQCRAEVERSCRQQHVMNRWVDRRTGRAGRRGLVDAPGAWRA